MLILSNCKHCKWPPLLNCNLWDPRPSCRSLVSWWGRAWTLGAYGYGNSSHLAPPPPLPPHLKCNLMATGWLAVFWFSNLQNRRLKLDLVHVLGLINPLNTPATYSERMEREMFYLTTHSTHFYLRLYGVRHLVKDHSDSERGNPLPPHRLLFPISSKGSFICTIPQTG